MHLTDVYKRQLVDNDLVSASTLHGIAMNRLYLENGFDPNTLEDAIKNNLNLQEVSYDCLLYTSRCV